MNDTEDPNEGEPAPPAEAGHEELPGDVAPCPIQMKFPCPIHGYHIETCKGNVYVSLQLHEWMQTDDPEHESLEWYMGESACDTCQALFRTWLPKDFKSFDEGQLDVIPGSARGTDVIWKDVLL